MKKLKALGIIAGVLVMALFLCMPILRPWVIGWMRYRALNKAMHYSDFMWARAQIAPVKKTFGDPPPGGHWVDIGYAKFETGKEYAPSSIHVSPDGMGGVISAGDYGIIFMNPSALEPESQNEHQQIETIKRTLPKTAAFMREMRADAVQSQIGAEQIRPLTRAEVSAMSEDEFDLYRIKLEQKLPEWGMHGVFWFEGASTKGIVRFDPAVAGDKGIAAHMLLGSHDGGKFVGCMVVLQPGKTGDVTPLAEQIAASFVFTIDNIADKDEMRRRIIAAGIK